MAWSLEMAELPSASANSKLRHHKKSPKSEGRSPNIGFNGKTVSIIQTKKRNFILDFPKKPSETPGVQSLYLKSPL